MLHWSYFYYYFFSLVSGCLDPVSEIRLPYFKEPYLCCLPIYT